MSKKVDQFLKEAVENIRDDREVTKELLDDVIKYLGKDDSRHREVGTVASKYVETLQRSNEQLVKVATLLQKRETGQQGLSDQDKNELFDLIKKGENERRE
tara:strand:+ start:248 stop:550 length:303 start_codon:yes stop_codon:yes gene_type:complete